MRVIKRRRSKRASGKAKAAPRWVGNGRTIIADYPTIGLGPPLLNRQSVKMSQIPGAASYFIGEGGCIVEITMEDNDVAIWQSRRSPRARFAFSPAKCTIREIKRFNLMMTGTAADPGAKGRCQPL
jgi:hypothetical protein